MVYFGSQESRKKSVVAKFELSIDWICAFRDWFEENEGVPEGARSKTELQQPLQQINNSHKYPHSSAYSPTTWMSFKSLDGEYVHAKVL
jgi:hypothetical protein